MFKKILPLIVLFASTKTIAQLSATQVDALVANAMEKFKVAGVAVAIVKDGKVLHAKGYGIRAMDTKLPVNENTNFQIASNSKAFTTAALAILVDEGKINWTDKVVNYLPEFKMYNAYVTENFTIEDLLCHRSGLGLGVGDLTWFPDGADFTIKDVLTNFQHFKPVSDFRTKFDYDNMLYLIAGELIKKVSGLTWEAFVRKNILKPLKMDNTYSSMENIADKNFAAPHSTETEGEKMKQFSLFKENINGAAAGILCNATDISKWMLMQLNQGKYGDSNKLSIFSPARQREMWKLKTVMDANPNPRYNSHFYGYGLGWFLSDVKGNLKVSHTGGLPGMLSQVCLIPDQKLGIAIFTNTENGGGALFSAVNNSIVDSYLNVPSMDWVNTYYTRIQQNKTINDSVTNNVWKQTENAKNIKINTNDYIGTYQDKWFGNVEIFVKDGALHLKCIRSPKLNGKMHFYKANTFAIKWAYQDMNCDAFAMFTLDEEGKAQGIKMKGISPNMDFSFDFQDLDFKRVK